MDSASLLDLRHQRFKELVADPDSLSAVTVQTMRSAHTERDLLKCMFGEKSVQALESAFSNQGSNPAERLSAVVSKSLQHAYDEKFPLHTLAEGVFRDLRTARGDLNVHDIRGTSRAFENVVTALSPPTHRTVLPANSAEWPQHIGTIEYAYASDDLSPAIGAASKDGPSIPARHYARLMRDLISQPISARRSTQAPAAAPPAVYMLSADRPAPSVVSEAKQKLLRALTESETATEFVVQLASQGNEEHLKAMERYLASSENAQSFDEFLAETLMAEMVDPKAYPHIAAELRSPSQEAPPPEGSIPELASPGSSIDDGDAGCTTDEESVGDTDFGSDGEIESEDESGGGDQFKNETHPTCTSESTAFGRDTTLWHHLVRNPHGGLGARDVSYLETIPCAIRDLGKTLFVLAAHWKRNQLAHSSGEFADMDPSEVEKYLDDRTAAIDGGQKAWTELMQEVGQARTLAILQAKAFLAAAGSHATEGSEPTTVMPSVHPNDSDRNETVVSYLHGVSAKLLHGWHVARTARPETGHGNEHLSATHTDQNEVESVKRGRRFTPDDEEVGKRPRRSA